MVVTTDLDSYPSQHYGVVLADPPWRMADWSGNGDKSKTPGAQYDLMDLDAIMALPVRERARKNAVLIVWAIQAMLPQAFEVMSAWGFTFKTAGAWAKQSKTGEKWAIGTGHIFRSAAEFFILGTRGSVPVQSKSVRNIIVAPVREHSRKPDEMHENIEKMYPFMPKLELFARERRPGWDVWGNQTEKFS